MVSLKNYFVETTTWDWGFYDMEEKENEENNDEEEAGAAESRYVPPRHYTSPPDGWAEAMQHLAVLYSNRRWQNTEPL